MEMDFAGRELPFVSRTGSIYFTPHPVAGMLRFRITIPRRIHKELMPFVTGEHSEEFTVLVCYWNDFPVTYVLEGNDVKLPDSIGVAIVREFLQKELKRLGAEADGVSLSCLGPSPFHANFHLAPCAEPIPDSSGIAIEKVNSKSTTILIRYDASHLKTSADAFARFSELTIAQFSYYYYQVALRHRRLDSAIRISNLTAGLIEMHQLSGFRGWVLRAFRSGRLAREISLAAISYEFETTTEQQSAKRTLDELYDKSSIALFRPWIESEIEEDFIAEHKASRETADLLEPRRLREANTLLVLLVAVISALMGATAKLLIG
ncbi:hypothetical protein ACPFP2_12300 [Micromonospora citrea]|uniref:hypothetical protein n=1 Tax=Micromonospora citrea TaxID=47855 RepID=UPI003C4446A4